MVKNFPHKKNSAISKISLIKKILYFYLLSEMNYDRKQAPTRIGLQSECDWGHMLQSYWFPPSILIDHYIPWIVVQIIQVADDQGQWQVVLGTAIKHAFQHVMVLSWFLVPYLLCFSTSLFPTQGGFCRCFFFSGGNVGTMVLPIV